MVILMRLTNFEHLPERMRTEAVRSYAEELAARRGALIAKRLMDLLLCGVTFLIALPFFLIFSVLVKLTSSGPVFFRQERMGRDMQPFFILKFRTMVQDADQKGVQLTTGNDRRITGFGKFLRATNMDEMPQLVNVLKGEMSVIGTRPEVRRYVEAYTDEMYATLLLAPGMLSNASVKYKKESELLDGAEDPQRVYVEQILPDKMRYNLEYLHHVSVSEDLKIIGRSIACMFRD